MAICIEKNLIREIDIRTRGPMTVGADVSAEL